MRTSRSRRCAGALVAVFAATLLLPLASLARTSPPATERHGCHCPVKMACCEAGLCHGDMDTSPSSSPSWSGCRDEAPLQAALPAPSTAFDGALLPEPAARPSGTFFRVPLVAAAGPEASGPPPAAPPPRTSIVSC